MTSISITGIKSAIFAAAASQVGAHFWSGLPLQTWSGHGYGDLPRITQGTIDQDMDIVSRQIYKACGSGGAYPSYTDAYISKKKPGADNDVSDPESPLYLPTGARAHTYNCKKNGMLILEINLKSWKPILNLETSAGVLSIQFSKLKHRLIQHLGIAFNKYVVCTYLAKCVFSNFVFCSK